MPIVLLLLEHGSRRGPEDVKEDLKDCDSACARIWFFEVQGGWHELGSTPSEGRKHYTILS
jgi:hypothetical protein